MTEHTDVFFDNNPVFKLGANAAFGGRENDRVVRQQDSLAKRLGLGTAVSRRRSCGGRSYSRQREGLDVRPRDIETRPAARDYKFLFNGIYYRAAAR